MPRTPQDVTDAELAVLQSMWERGDSTVRGLAETVYPGGGASQNATVQKLLERLETKQFVLRDRHTWPHTFRAVVDRGELIARRLRLTAEKLCNGSNAPLLTHLVRSKGLSQDERRSLRELLDDLDSGRSPSD